MKTVKTYRCVCGEDFYEDDVKCINCGVKINKNKLEEIEITKVGYVRKKTKTFRSSSNIKKKMKEMK